VQNKWIKENRYGMFRIDWNLIDDMTVTQLKRIFSHFIVLKCEDDGMRRVETDIFTLYSSEV